MILLALFPVLVRILVFLIMLSVLVLIHELGHFLVAKKLGIKVEEFGFGFPPRVFKIKRGETVYSINWLPIGGFVKLYGEDEAGGARVKIVELDSPDESGKKHKHKEDTRRAFFARPVWQRASVVVAGVVMNTVLAVIISYVFLALSGFTTELPLLGEHRFLLANQCTLLGISVVKVAPDSPAQQIGITDCSSIIAVNGARVDNNAKFFVDTINKNKGKQITISWKDGRLGIEHTAPIVPRVNAPAGQGALGIQFGQSQNITAILSYDTLTQKIFSGIVHPMNLLLWNLDGFAKLIGIAVSEKSIAPVGEGLGGPIAISAVVGSILDIKDIKIMVLQLLNLGATLSVILAFFNILPIPALDGGRLFFILTEGVIGKKVNPKLESTIHTIGMVALLTLMLVVTFKDLKMFILDKIPFGH